jgi:hypothetical protein
MSFKLHNKIMILNAKTWHIYYTWNSIFATYVGMMEILWRSMAQGIWIQQVFACVFLSFSFLGH